MIAFVTSPARDGRCRILAIRRIARINHYTRRFLGGRQPLCGIGVTSMMFITL
jgi:hypothetical protein